MTTTTAATSSSEILNSYIAAQKSSSKTTTTTEANSLWGDFDTFLQILTTQLENQDPTDPADASEFTSQLVQYAEVEQQISANDKLDKILSTINSNGITPLLNYIGEYVEVSAGDDLLVQNGQALMTYNLPSEAQTVVVTVQDSKGDAIATINGATESGLNRVAWDGTLSDGTTAEDGEYSFLITAKDSNGDIIEISDVRIIGQITGIETDSDGDLSLQMGSMSIADTAIMSVFAAVGTSSSTAEES